MPGSPFQDGPVNAQGMNMDADSNLWISSYGSDSVWVFPGGNAAKSFGYTLYNGSQPFDLHFFEGKAWVACGGGISGADANSSLTQFEIQGSELVLLQQVWFGQAIKGFDIDAQGNMWVASQGDSLIYKVNQQGQVVGKFNGGGLNGPWSATVDGDGNVYVATVMAMAIPSDFQNTISVHARMCPAG
jgi:sugar lactone lactonase YvrE